MDYLVNYGNHFCVKINAKKKEKYKSPFTVISFNNYYNYNLIIFYLFVFSSYCINHVKSKLITNIEMRIAVDKRNVFKKVFVNLKYSKIRGHSSIFIESWSIIFSFDFSSFFFIFLSKDSARSYLHFINILLNLTFSFHLLSLYHLLFLFLCLTYSIITEQSSSSSIIIIIIIVVVHFYRFLFIVLPLLLKIQLFFSFSLFWFQVASNP